jgi:hypothetical protein
MSWPINEGILGIACKDRCATVLNSNFQAPDDDHTGKNI